MTLKLSDRDVENLLRQTGRPVAPPADLLARLRADLPAELDVAPASGERGRTLRPARWNRPLLSLAATLAVLIGGSLIAYRTFRQNAEPASDTATAVMTSPSAGDGSGFRDQAVASQPAAPAPQEPPAEALSRPAVSESDRIARLDAPRSRPEPKAKKSSPPSPPVLAEGATAAAPAGIDGGVVAGMAPPSQAPADTDQERLEPAAEEEALELHRPAEMPATLESPAAEAPGAGAPPSQVEYIASMKASTLETTSTLDHLRSTGAVRGAPLAAPLPKADEILLGAASAGDEAWRVIERALADGRWPNGAEIAAARQAPLAPAAAARPGGFASRQRTGAERKGDSWSRLREDSLDFLAREEKSRRDLLELRRRTLRLLELEPGDPRGSELLRILNLASGKLA